MAKKKIVLYIALTLCFALLVFSLTGCSVLEGFVGNSGNSDNNEGNTGDNTEQQQHFHDWSEWETVTLPTTSDYGEIKRTCACGEVESKTIPRLDNVHYNVEIIDSTCSQEGKKTYTLNQDYSDYRGIDYSFFETIEKKPHNFVYEGDDSGHWQVCQTCGFTTEKEAHDLTNSNGCFKCGQGVDTSYFGVSLNKDGVAFLTLTGKALPKNLVIPSVVDGHKIYGFSSYDGLFKNSEVENVYIQDGIEALDGFYNCKKLKNIYIPGSVKYILTNAFYNCTSLENIVLHEGTMTIQPRAFWNSGLKEITIPKSVKYIKEGAFGGVRGVKFNLAKNNNFYKIANGCLIENYGEKRGTLIATGRGSVPTDAGITRIGEYAMWSYGNYGSQIRIPSGVKEIGSNAFYLSQAQSFYLPTSVEVIESYAFRSCNHLTTVNIPINVTVLNGSIFDGCSFLNNIRIEGEITTMDKRVFSGVNGDCIVRFSKITEEPPSWPEKWDYIAQINGVDKYVTAKWATPQQ